VPAAEAGSPGVTRPGNPALGPAPAPVLISACTGTARPREAGTPQRPLL